jgi:hypothetical protein
MAVDNPLGTDNGMRDATQVFANLIDPPEEDTQEDGETTATETDEVDEADTQSEEEQSEPDESADDEQSEDATEEPRYRVKVNGEDIEIPLSEALKGYQRQADYTRKTEELARQRRDVEAQTEQELTQLRAERQYIESVLQQVSALQPQQEQIDWNHLKETDPIEFGVKWAEHQQRREYQQQLNAEQQRLAQVRQQEQQAMFARHLESERTRLLQLVPEWSDAAVAKREKQAIVELGKSIGYTEQELEGAADHRAIIVLRDAMKYRELMAKKPQVKPEQVTRVVKPGSANVVRPKDKLADAQKRLAKSGKTADAVAVFKNLIG